jgi:hypothetical protein
MTTHQILPATPKKSTSSRCTTGDGGFVPWRTQDAKEYRERMAQVSAPTPRQALIDRNIASYRQQVAADEAAEHRRRTEMRERIRREEQAAKDLKERQRRGKEFRQAEALVDLALGGLTPAERGRVNTRLLAAGRIHDALLAAAFANEEIVSRGQPVDSSDGTEIDWRSALKKQEKN